MNHFTAIILLNAMKMVTDGSLMQTIVNLVNEMMDFNLSGEEKKREVLRHLKEIGGELQPIVAATAGYILNLAVEIAVAYIKSKAE